MKEEGKEEKETREESNDEIIGEEHFEKEEGKMERKELQNKWKYERKMRNQKKRDK